MEEQFQNIDPVTQTQMLSNNSASSVNHKHCFLAIAAIQSTIITRRHSFYSMSSIQQLIEDKPTSNKR